MSFYEWNVGGDIRRERHSIQINDRVPAYEAKFATDARPGDLEFKWTIGRDKPPYAGYGQDVSPIRLGGYAALNFGIYLCCR